MTEESGRWDPRRSELVHVGAAERWILNGTKTFVLDGCIADLLFWSRHAPMSGYPCSPSRLRPSHG